MSQKRNPLLFLTDIASAIERIESYTKSGKQEFFKNTALQDATFFRLQTIGEAVIRRVGKITPVNKIYII